MIVVVESATFKKWVGSLQDRRAVARINARIRSISLGNLGDSKPVANKVSEMRIHYGPGYRLYYTRKGDTVVVLLCGGVKGSQRRDIERAKRLADEWR
ncbi:MAG: type II toxin-antitoxin system RelE/ParE family toxin [Dehalococcoidia bacterium]|nr:type II toxin-antitoxin system RelE/ParE family toxin [Dehalococcoidia bacterium]